MHLKDYPKDITLKEGRRVVIRPLERGDCQKLHSFFEGLPEEDRLYLRHDVRDLEIIRGWTEGLDFDRVIPLVAEEGDKFVADGTLHLASHGWMQHVGHIRLVIAPSHRKLGLGTVLARELVGLAEERNLEKLQAHVIEDNTSAVRMFQRLGFEVAAVLKGLAKDQHGKNQNLAILVNDVASLCQRMEDWIMDSMIPAYRSGSMDG